MSKMMIASCLCIFMFLIVPGCGKTEPPGSFIEELSDENSSNAPAQQPSEDTAYKYGDTVAMDGYTLEFKGAYLYDTSLGLNEVVNFVFEATNTSSEDFSIWEKDFEAYADDYLVYDREYAHALEKTGTNHKLGGTIAPGKKIAGYVEFRPQDNFQVIELRYTDKEGKHITFVINRDEFEESRQ